MLLDLDGWIDVFFDGLLDFRVGNLRGQDLGGNFKENLKQTPRRNPRQNSIGFFLDFFLFLSDIFIRCVQDFPTES